MKKQISLIALLILMFHQSYSQCNFQTVNRPDGITIEYFNPKPVIIKNNYEAGISVYKNKNNGEFTLNLTLLFKNLVPKELNKSLVIQTNSDEGIELDIVVSKLMTMNGAKVAIAQYFIDQRSLDILRKYDLKTLYFYINGDLIGSTIDKGHDIIRNQINCLTR